MIKASTIEQYSQILRSKIQNFRWETMTQKDALAKIDEIRQDLLDYYNKYRKRQSKYDGKKGFD